MVIVASVLSDAFCHACTEQVMQPGFIQQHLLMGRLPQGADLLFLAPGRKGLLLHCQDNELFEVLGFWITTAGLQPATAAPLDLRQPSRPALGKVVANPR